MAFVNPYTFIAFPNEVRRRPPLGHAPTRAEAKERYTGTLTVSWAVKSPLAIPADGSWGLGDGGQPGSAAAGEICIPGASVKGAVRSLHEALFGGCARVIDPLFTPVYRDMMTTKLLDGWTLGVIVSDDADVTEGSDPAVRVMPCSVPVAWTRGAAVTTAAGPLRLPQSGDFVRPARPLNDPHRPNTYASVEVFRAAERGAGWLDTFRGAVKDGLSVILVTDTAARDPQQPYYWATAKPNPAEGLKQVSAAALLRFRQRLRGADRAPEGAAVFESVSWPPPPPGEVGVSVARRRTVDGYLRQGDVVWVQLANNEVVDIKLSLGWRTPATGNRTTLVSRIPEHVKPCRHLAKGLCLSCVVFGSVDATASDEQRGAQDSYGGHVRFGDVTGMCTTGKANIALAPLGMPHPGAGMFYLDPISHADMQGKWERPDFPSRWDSVAGESKGSRDLRGRKFYWHSDPVAQQHAHHLTSPRYQQQPGIHTNPGILPHVHLVERAELEQTITFDGLDDTALASLLATLSPSLLLGAGRQYALHLGRGKPLGLGSVQTTVTMKMTRTADRYADGAQLLTELPGLTSALKQGVAERCGDLNGVNKEAVRVLDIAGLGDQAVDVSYPTVKPWNQFAQPAFHESFTYFQQNAGQVKKNRDKQLVRDPWAPLPRATDSPGQGGVA